jgi:hypothetical protein
MFILIIDCRSTLRWRLGVADASRGTYEVSVLYGPCRLSTETYMLCVDLKVAHELTKQALYVRDRFVLREFWIKVEIYGEVTQLSTSKPRIKTRCMRAYSPYNNDTCIPNAKIDGAYQNETIYIATKTRAS